MTQRKALVMVAGGIKEMPLGDHLQGQMPGIEEGFDSLLRAFVESAAGETLRAAIDPTGQYSSLYPLLDFRRSAWLSSGSNTTTWSYIGFPQPSSTGTPAAVNPSDGTVYSMLRGMNHPTTRTAGTLGGVRIASIGCKMGGSSGNPGGGFISYMKYGIGDAVSGARQFCGVSSSTGAPTNVNPNTLTNSIGFGADGTNANMRLFYGGSSAQTPIDMGANFPINSANQVYDQLLISYPLLGTCLGYSLRNIVTGNVSHGALTGKTQGTQLPATSTLLTAIQMWRTNNATAQQATLKVAESQLYVPF